MSKRAMVIDWSKKDGASPKPKRLHLEEDENDKLYHCPVQNCVHDGYSIQSTGSPTIDIIKNTARDCILYGFPVLNFGARAKHGFPVVAIILIPQLAG